MALTNDQITAQNFKEFYGQIRPYLNGSAHAGFTPVGTVISVMGKQAPLNYLVCDGTIYNIKDYPELAAYFVGQFEVSNFFGGDGETTFAVPDLRGEFLRGTGINSHSGQGNGGNVGTHQDATEYAVTGTSYEGNKDYLSMPHAQNIGAWAGYVNADKTRGSGTNGFIAMSGSNDNGRAVFASSRPTNTSVLYCIATKNIFMDAGCNYSTDEVVVGTWINGKPLYQKTMIMSSGYTSEIHVPNNATGVSVNGITDIFMSSIKPTLDKIVYSEMDANDRVSSGSSYHHSYPYRFNKDNGYIACVDNYMVGFQENIALYPGTAFTLRYTKSTD